MSAHTPGPWQVVSAGTSQSRWIVGDREGGSIADCEPPGPWMSDGEADANAQLIAAAPDLVEALKACVIETVDYMTINELGDPEQQHNVKQARAALAKAGVTL
jgi:hypothetical protein